MTILQNETLPGVRKEVAHREISHDDLQPLRLLAMGLPVDAVARRLDLSERTVRRRTRAACDGSASAPPSKPSSGSPAAACCNARST
jgi:hypothetical protein